MCVILWYKYCSIGTREINDANVLLLLLCRYIAKEKTGILNIIIVVSERARDEDITINRILHSNDIYIYLGRAGP